MARTLSKKPKSDLSRLRRFAKNHLGVIMTDDLNTTKEWRSDFLDLLDRYYENNQYDDLIAWDEATAPGQDEYVPVRKRKPRMIYNLGKVLVDKVAAKLTGSSAFPSFVVEDDDEATAFFRVVQKASKFRKKMIEPIKHMLISGAVFVRYYLVNGQIQIEYTKSKYCWPTFDELGELSSVEIKYVYDDGADLKPNGDPTKKWFRILLTKTADIMYDTPEYRPGVKATFEEVSRNEHGLGWVQGEWMNTHDDKFDFDGYGLYCDILGFIDELNYSLSQGSQANSYAQEPQLTVTKIDEDELETLVKSSSKAWNLGREGEAKFLESTGKGIEAGIELRDKVKRFALDVVRVEINDPEKHTGTAQSGDALQQLQAPLCELVDELRAMLEGKLVNLLIKIGMTCLHYNALGMETAIETPPGYLPGSLDITTHWPPIFPPTLADINMAAAAANTLSTGQIISRDSLTRWIAQMLPNIDNIEEELKKIEVQEPLPSPFGTFDQGGF